MTGLRKRSDDVCTARDEATRVIIAMAVLGIAALSSGCPGELEDPQRFIVGSTSTTCETGLDVERDLFAARCGASGCHGATDPSADLDLASPGVASRLVGVASSGCGSALLIDPANPTGGVLLDKLTLPQCGARMPLLDDALAPDELACVRGWVAFVAGAGDGMGARDGGMPADAGVADGGAR